MSSDSNPRDDHGNNGVTPQIQRWSATDLEYTAREEALLLAEVQQAVYDLFVNMRRLWFKPVSFDDIEDAYCARDPQRRSGYPDNLVGAVQSWIIENTNADRESDRLFFVDEESEVLDSWHINEHVIPSDVRERRRRARPVPRDPEQRRPTRPGQVIRSERYRR